ncbi:MAG: heavy-metal-associated domain-containing protein [Cryobacterium sp.]|nr:heavy-metal-associated domain-containing protein [Oligoflexia bacterium]
MSKLSILLLFSALAPTLSFGKTIEVRVNGMVCAFCAQGITKKFSAKPGVKKVDVSLKEKTVKLDMSDDQDLKDSEIISILKDSGYAVEKISR